MRAKSLMVQGTHSSAGKSLLVTALCRIFKRRGLKTAPFKSQNMSLNSYITAEGHEIGRAQAAQAQAAGIEPTAAMNPVLLKPSGERKSQVIVMGKALTALDARAYYAFRRELKKTVQAAYDSLAERYDLVIIEGAGSPAEINLRKDDIANMGMAAMAEAPVILVGDIDRGGVFASLYGTVKLLPDEEQRRIKAFVVNKFRGDVSILEPGLREIEGLLAMPSLGVLPYWDVRIDEEDSLSSRLDAAGPPGAPGLLDVVAARLPRMSNFTDFAAFDILPGVSLRYAASARQLGRPDLIVIPGSKNSIDDMLFLHESGMAQSILDLHAQGVPVMGVCGGFQMLGKTIRDPHGVESDIAEVAGLGLLDMESTLLREKRTVRSSVVLADRQDGGPLRGMSGMRLSGYEIHMGKTSGPALARPLGHFEDGAPEGAASQDGSAFGTYLHGIFDNMSFTTALLNNLAAARGYPPLPAQAGGDYEDFREREYDRLADMVEEHIDMAVLQNIINGRL